MRPIVQNWSGGALPPFGFRVQVGGTATTGYKRFSPGESGAALAPQLKVVWEPCTTITGGPNGPKKVCGAIRGHYFDLGGPAVVGYPTTDELPTPDGQGRYNHFAHNGNEDTSIYFHPDARIQAASIGGSIRARWAALGWENGLGYPVTDETPTPDSRGRYNHFIKPGAAPVSYDGINSSIYWTPALGAHDVQGAVRAKWAEQRFEAGLGFPSTGETAAAAGGRYNDFSNPDGGLHSVYWSPATGAHNVKGGIRQTWLAPGGAAGWLGYPTTSEQTIAGGWRSAFQGGNITFDGRTGTTTVSSPAPTVESVSWRNDGGWSGAAGVAGAFSVTPPALATSTTYSIDGSSPVIRATSNAFQVEWTPTSDGPHVVAARARNAQGYESESAGYRFNVGVIGGQVSTEKAQLVAETSFDAELQVGVEPVPSGPGDVDIEPGKDRADYLADLPATYEADTTGTTASPETDTHSSKAVATMPGTADGAMRLGGVEGFSVDLPGSSSAAPVLTAQSALLYANSGNGTDTAAVAKGDQVETWHILRDATAATSFDYRVDVPPGHSLSVNAEGIGAVLNERLEPVSFVDAPWAVDATGRRLPTALSLTGTTVRVAVTTDERVVYPVLLDPVWTYLGYKYYVSTPEQKYCVYPSRRRICKIAFDASNLASSEAGRRFPGTLYLGAGDAFRHCYWNALMTISLGSGTAAEFATRHEEVDSGVSKEMDLRNNRIGRQIGSGSGGNKTSARNTCESRARSNGLWTVVNGQLR